jgi:hexosaminidase
MMLKRTIALCSMLLAAMGISFAAQGRYDIIPAPSMLAPAPGQFRITKATGIQVEASDASFKEVADDFSAEFKTVSGIDLKKGGAKGSIILRQVEGLGSEEYALTVTSDGVLAEASSRSGAFYALQTLRQLLPPEVYGDRLAKGVRWEVPCCVIKDKPRFAYRSMMLDVCRYFMPKDAVEKFIDVMAMHKQNVFHWHLTDDQGWRIEIKKYPRLTEVGAWRPFTADYDGKNPDGTPHGGFYTQDDIREIVEYARRRCVTVVPELELPGHSTAAIAAYPELSCDSSRHYEVATDWGVKKDVYCPNAFTFRFLEDVLTEMFGLFPSPYYHIGGDECPKDAWKQSAYCQDFMEVLGLKSEHELQTFFVRRMDSFLREHGKTAIGWDEILDGSAVDGTIVQSYRGHAPAAKAIRRGLDVILSPNRWCYLDYYQTDMEKEPKAQALFLPMRKVYDYFPVVDSIPDLSARYIVGYECCVWGEYDQNPARMEYLAWPRGVAAAEVGWTARQDKDWDSFRSRMEKELRRLDIKHVGYCKSYYDVVVNFDRKAGFPRKVTLTLDYPDAQIHYTTDGTEPTGKSPVYRGDTLTFGTGAFVKARGFRTDGKPVGTITEKTF